MNERRICMAEYSKQNKKCKTCGHNAKALIKKEFGGSRWYKCMNCREMIGEMNDPIKDAFYDTTLGKPYK